MATPLHADTTAGAFESCARLPGFGTNKSVADKYGLTPLIGAMLGGHQLLPDYGAEKNHKVSSSYKKLFPAIHTALDRAINLNKKKSSRR